jgi:uncharacterized protein
MAKFLCPTKLSENISETPEGYLLCKGVAIARTGVMEYGEGETPLEVGDDGIVYVSRTAEELFCPRAIASFEGKSLTVRHPEQFVDPYNWKELTKGTMHNVRRSEELDEDGEEVLLADVLVTEAFAITLVKNGLREVSCGYEAEYEQTGKGKGKQSNIVGNHLALVEEGRAGSSYAIRDHNRKVNMKEKLKQLLQLVSRGKTVDQAIAEMEKGSKKKVTKPAESKQVTDAKAIIKKAQKVIDDANGQTANLSGGLASESVVMDAEKQKAADELKKAYDALGYLIKGAMGGGYGADEEKDDDKDKSKDEDDKDDDKSEDEDDDDAEESSDEEKDDDKDKSKDEDDKDDDKKSKDSDEDSIESRLKALEQALTKLLEAKSGDEAEEEESEEAGDEDVQGGEEKKKKTGDAALAEILCPGFEVPKKGDMRVAALKAAMQTTDGKAAILSICGGKAPKLDNANVGFLFNAAAQIMKAKNGIGLDGTKSTKLEAVTFDNAAKSKEFGMTPEQMNEANAAHYAAQK